MKKEFKFYISILFLIFTILGSLTKPICVEEALVFKSEKYISPIKGSKPCLFYFSCVEQKDLNPSYPERKNFGHSSINYFFSNCLFSFCVFVFILHFFKFPGLSYWDQKIQILSSRPHPPTYYYFY